MDDYRVDFGGWIATGWQRFLANWQALTGFSAIYLVVTLAISLPLGFVMGFSGVFIARLFADQIGFDAAFKLTMLGFSMLNLLISVPLSAFFMGGLIGGGLEVARGRASSVGEMFDFSKRSFLPMLGFMSMLAVISIVQQLLGTSAELALPRLLPDLTPQLLPLIGAAIQILLAVAIGLICVPFFFTAYLIQDQEVAPLEAMPQSWSVFNRHYLMNMLFVFTVILISCSGVFACCLGLFFTVPLSMPMFSLMYLGVFKRE